MIKLKPFAGLVALIALTIFSSCKKENSDDTDTPVTPTPSGNSTYLSGTVVDRTGSLLEGVTVFYGSEITTTDNHGYFTFGSVSCGERVYVRTEKNGFFNGSLGAIASVSSQTNLNIVMTDNSVDYTFNAAAGQLINLPGGASIDFTPNSIATESGTAYNGNVNVASEYLDPDDLDFQNIIPGGDLIGMDQDDAMQQLVSYGMLMVTLTDNSGNELNLLSGNNATITMPVPASMASDAPSQMPLWHYDEITGIWMEEGSATLIGGEYVGTVTHFSSWNADVPSDRAQVRGIVYDCNGQPMAGIQVTVGQGSATTGSNGEFQRYVPTGVSFDVYVNSSALGLTSSSVNVPSMTAGDVFDAIQLSTECVAYVSFNITCNNGGDVNGYAAVNWGNQYTYVNITHTGNYKYLYQLMEAAVR
ncbi:MAG: carboxypeptidase regulatory-like domain-containing protein [Flavobacteriales bacterium]|nr:carboxypeptidase regulatory-like domain-containing protein [Flavobacteriales bacterium]